MQQWQTFIEGMLDAHASKRWVLKPNAQRYERQNGRVQDAEPPWRDFREDDRLAVVRDAGELEDHIRALPRQHRDVLFAGFLSTRNLKREVEAEHGAGAWDGSTTHKGVAVTLGKRALVCALTPTAIETGVHDKRHPLGLVIAAACPPLDGTPKLVLKARAALLAKVLPERDALVRAACAALAERVGVEVQPEEKPEVRQEPRERAPRFKMPSWALEMRQAVAP